jgi:hypothetical protein
MSRKNPLKSAHPAPGPSSPANSIIVDKTTTDSRWGCEDLYEFSDINGNPAGRGKKASSGDSITWYCDEPFTFLAADKSHWAPAKWKALPLTGGTAFIALNSSAAAQPGLPTYSLTLQVIGNPGDTRRYTITIPQLDLTNLSPLGDRANNPPDNTLVRATVILQ